MSAEKDLLDKDVVKPTKKLLDEFKQFAIRGNAVDLAVGKHSSRSQLIEKAILEFLARRDRAKREARDRELIDRAADQLNAEVEDVLSYQSEP